VSEPYRREASITGEYRLEIEDLGRALDAHPPIRRFKHAWMVGVPLLGLAIGVPIASGAELSSTMPYLVIGIALTFASVAIRRAPRTQLAKKTDAQRALRVIVREHGYRIETIAGEAHELNWSSVQSAAVTEHGVFLLRATHADVLPRRAFSEEAFAEVVATVRRNVQPAAPPRRSRMWALGLWLVLVVGMYAIYQLVHDRRTTVVPVDCTLELELATEDGEVVAWARLRNTTGEVVHGDAQGIGIALFADGAAEPIDWLPAELLDPRPYPIEPGMVSGARDASFYPEAPGRYRVRAEHRVSPHELDALARLRGDPFRLCVPPGPVEAVIDVP